MPVPLLLLCATLLLTPAVRVAAEGHIHVDAQRVGDLVEVRARATLGAPLALVWATLTDYERLPEFIPGIQSSRILSRNGATTTVQQIGEARFLFLSVPIDVTVESTERPPHIHVRRIAGTLRHLQGRYETEILPAHPAQVRLRWIGTIAPEAELPPLIGQALIRILIGEQFAGMVAEIERRERARREAVAGTKGTPAGANAVLPAPTAPAEQQDATRR